MLSTKLLRRPLPATIGRQFFGSIGGGQQYKQQQHVGYRRRPDTSGQQLPPTIYKRLDAVADINHTDLARYDHRLNNRRPIRPLAPLDTDGRELLDELSPVVPLSYNLAAYANRSVTIEMLIKLGVNLVQIENTRPEIAGYILQLDFEADIKPYIEFLVNVCGVWPSQLADFITRNPLIFSQHMDDLNVRLNYYRSKRFTKDMIAAMVTNCPELLNNTTKYVDYKLAFMLKEFRLSAADIRQLMTRCPNLVLLNDMAYRELTFIFAEEFGFNGDEIRSILLKSPELFLLCSKSHKSHRIVIKVFDLVHNDMMISHELLTKFPQILMKFRQSIESRHLYLKRLGRAQYDPTKPLYVPLTAFYELEDNEFADKYAKTSVNDFNCFCKSL
ncbi:transcription termination factor 3, mitochondrial-like [Oppia nitens]|uniref:transcription termination factor 3, mitochondrial-like n=1 Tax=Oppia nitens TaxID=1686743 RepID=UPI0023DAF6DF|nr:transcription termination factor 3, mitochondrial-like [Oppia nitens]